MLQTGSATSTSSLPPPRKLKLLALHSFRTSARIFKDQFERAKLGPQTRDLVEVVFIDAPHLASGALPKDVLPYWPEGPHYEWFTVDQMGDQYVFDEDKLRISTELVARVLKEQGPFDGLVGFSQGSILASALIAMQHRGIILQDVPPLRLVILFAGLRSVHPDHIAATDNGKLKVPSLHIYGDKDNVIEHCHHLVEAFEGAVVLRHARGHVIPRLSPVHLACLRAFLSQLLTAGEGAGEGGGGSTAALQQSKLVAQISMSGGGSVLVGTDREYLVEEGERDEEVVAKAADIQTAIQEGSSSFLMTEYRYIGVFMVIMAVTIFSLLSMVPPEDGRTKEDELRNGAFSTIAFVIGGVTSCTCGYLGMMIATFANARTAIQARKGIAPAFMCAFRSGAVMGFLLSGLGLLTLFSMISMFKQFYGDDWVGLFEAVTGYGLGGSSIALFGRVGGGIYTKAADVGADLVGKIEQGIPEDDPRNPAVIADNVGDNVGDIAGMGADLFGSFAESTCAALVISSLSSLGDSHDFVGLTFPLSISAAGILVCIATTFIATDLKPAKVIAEIEHTLKMQLIISTIAMTPVAYFIAIFSLPESFTLPREGFPDQTVQAWYMFVVVSVGLWGGLLIGLQTEYFTSNRYKPVQDVADACRTGAATDIIFGLALGYKSTIIPSIVIACIIFCSNSLAGMYGIACAALGMLSTLASGLAIDAYGPISDNAGGIAEMAGMGEDVRERTDALDAAGNTTAAIGKGFCIGSAALVSLALFGAFVTRAKIDMLQASILDPKVFSGLLFGAMLPYWFSAMTMKSVGKAALQMVEEVRRQFRTIPGLMEGTARPDYKRCVEISTAASLTEMIPPGCLVMLSPILMGILFGTQALAGMLTGSLVSGVQLAVSMSNTGGAWDNAKKYIEAGASPHARELGPKGSDCHKAAVIGDTVGDPLKDTSGPSLNILVKLMAVESLVFAPFFAGINDGQGLVFHFFGW
ncbi:hypothetical protein FOA52_000737 [Chlamydomonas sp. UWO 241]|nr:hypothetical protein FOA52_000737 [Chlamydomonas sp. UWO 241]